MRPRSPSVDSSAELAATLFADRKGAGPPNNLGGSFVFLTSSCVELLPLVDVRAVLDEVGVALIGDWERIGIGMFC